MSSPIIRGGYHSIVEDVKRIESTFELINRFVGLQTNPKNENKAKNNTGLSLFYPLTVLSKAGKSRWNAAAIDSQLEIKSILVDGLNTMLNYEGERADCYTMPPKIYSKTKEYAEIYFTKSKFRAPPNYLQLFQDFNECVSMLNIVTDAQFKNIFEMAPSFVGSLEEFAESRARDLDSLDESSEEKKNISNEKMMVKFVKSFNRLCLLSLWVQQILQLTEQSINKLSDLGSVDASEPERQLLSECIEDLVSINSHISPDIVSVCHGHIEKIMTKQMDKTGNVSDIPINIKIQSGLLEKISRDEIDVFEGILVDNKSAKTESFDF